MSASHGWSLVDTARKQEILAAIRSGEATTGPVHAELDLTDRCNVACYFCNQMDVRTKESLPLDEVESLLDEMVSGGLKSVRLSGGGDPLMYPQFAAVQQALAQRGVVIDNLTTNGALLTEEIAGTLVRQQAREVIFSLNAVDAEDYQRMMKVRARTFDQVLANIRRLLELRASAPLPTVVVQFLLDPANYRRLPEMYRLGRELGVDRIALNAVLEIPLDRLKGKALLGPKDHPLVRPYLAEVLQADRDAGALQVCFPWPEWNQMTEELRAALALPGVEAFPAAPAFREKNGQCFFGWYTATIRGTGEMYPCCLLMSPDYQPLGNVREGGFAAQWRGEGFTRLRQEMREVFLTDGRMFNKEKRFQTLRPQCIEPHRCALKNMYFRGDQEFYQQMDEALQELRAEEVSWLGSPRQAGRAAEILAYRVYHGVLVRSRALWRRKLRKPFLRLMPELFRHPKLHIGCGNKHLPQWVNIDLKPLPEVDLVADVRRGLRFRGAQRIYAEHLLEHLTIGAAVDFLKRCHHMLARDGVLRLSTPNLDWVWLTHYRLEGGPEERAAMAIALNRAFHGWQHQFLWNRPFLAKVLTACGFVDLRWPAYGESEHADLRQLERHEASPDSADLPHVLIVEGRKGPAQPRQLAELQQGLVQDYLKCMEGSYALPAGGPTDAPRRATVPAGQPLRLHVGCGDKRLEGWLNIDRTPLPEVDAVADVVLDGLPYQEAEAVYAEHFLEHLPLDAALRFLENCHRALAAGGALRLSTPNLDWVWATHYSLEREEEVRALMPVHLNRAFHGWEHCFLWNHEMMALALTACGFTDISWHRHGESERPLFRGIERHEVYPDSPLLPHVLIVEAVRGESQPEKLAALQQRIRDEFLNHLQA